MSHPYARWIRPAPVELTPIEVAAEILETYVGVYELSPDLSLVVSLEDGGLFLEPTDQGKYPMFAESETKFFLRVKTRYSSSCSQSFSFLVKTCFATSPRCRSVRDWNRRKPRKWRTCCSRPG